MTIFRYHVRLPDAIFLVFQFDRTFHEMKWYGWSVCFHYWKLSSKTVKLSAKPPTCQMASPSCQPGWSTSPRSCPIPIIQAMITSDIINIDKLFFWTVVSRYVFFFFFFPLLGQKKQPMMNFEALLYLICFQVSTKQVLRLSGPNVPAFKLHPKWCCILLRQVKICQIICWIILKMIENVYYGIVSKVQYFIYI